MATRTDIIQAIRARKRFRAGAMEGRTSEKGDYYVAKYFENGDPPRIVKRNLSREEAQAIVRKPGTSGGTTPNRWFLGFDKAHPKRED